MAPFFTSYRTGNAEYYWVDARIIDYLRDHDLDLVAQLTEAMQTDGVDAARILHTRLRDLHTGWHICDERLFDDVADELIASGNTALAIEVLQLNMSLYPESGLRIRNAKLAALQNDAAAMTELRGEFLKATDLGEDELNSWGRFLVRNDQLDAMGTTLRNHSLSSAMDLHSWVTRISSPFPRLCLAHTWHPCHWAPMSGSVCGDRHWLATTRR